MDHFRQTLKFNIAGSGTPEKSKEQAVSDRFRVWRAILRRDGLGQACTRFREGRRGQPEEVPVRAWSMVTRSETRASTREGTSTATALLTSSREAPNTRTSRLERAVRAWGL